MTTIQDTNIAVPKSMVDALEMEDPFLALMALSQHASTQAESLAQQLTLELSAQLPLDLPDLLRRLPNLQDADSHPVATAVACSDSIFHSLTKIASGGSQASQEIKQLEEEKRALEEHAQDVETALVLRRASDQAAQSLSAQRYSVAAQAIQEYNRQKEWSRLNDRAKAYAGEYTVTQLESTQQALKTTLLERYQTAVENSDMMELGKLTPLVQMVQMEPEAVGLYLRFLKEVLSLQLEKAAATTQEDKKKPPYVPMARVYNAAVTTLRHHLPMVSHCLHRADGDAAVVQLVHLQVEQAVIPLFQRYLQAKKLAVSARNAQQVYNTLEDRYSSASQNQTMSAFPQDDSADTDDAGFSTLVGTLADVDAAMEEAALLLQHAESYTRFIQHTVREVNKARALRHQHEQEERRMERERKEWSTGMSTPHEEQEEVDYVPIEVLPARTQLQGTLAELGGYYSAVERCLLLASMHRAFVTSRDEEEDPSQLSPLSLMSSSSMVGTRAVQTSVVEACLYATRRGVQRAFATGHTGTASAMANYSADCLRGVLAEFLARRAEDWGVTSLKPGEGLLAGSAGIFNATNLIRQGQQVSHAVGGVKVDQLQQQQEIEQGITFACATFNDLEVAAHHTSELEKILNDSVDKGFPPGTHETEQLRMCVKSFSPVAEYFKLASNTAVESLVSVLKPRLRAIVTDAVGGDGTGAGFSSVMGGSKSTDRHAVRMNYDLDEEAYQLLEVSEGYISRLCTCLDELILPLSTHLSPQISDDLVLGVLGTVAKRLEVSLKKCRFTSLGALSLDSDMRDLLNYSKDRLESNELSSNVALYRACTPLARLVQIAKLLNVDDLEDVLDLIGASKRKGNWDLKLDEARSFLALRVEFESSRINELLKIPDDD
eukprot:Nitzschia sp. Nitz4//scaffold98_size77359//3539//6343//NITZ4_005533-RA/size77359-snap-gene-0.0-mRNA-1//1//CDS//3329560712//6189//frame0